MKIIEVENYSLTLQIWDTAGTEKFNSINWVYYSSAHGIIVVFDLTKRESFNQIKLWIESIHNNSDDNIEIVLIGNKLDLCREINFHEGHLLAKEYQIPYFETSAKGGTEIDDLFLHLARTFIHKKISNDDISELHTYEDENKSQGCDC
jgi:small GTP-binding protein